MPVRFTTAGPARPTVHQIDDSPFLPPGNGWNRRGEPVPDEEKVPAPERMFDGDGRLAYAAGALVPKTELAALVPESRLHQAQDGYVPEPEPVSAKPTKAKTRARKPSENRSG